MPLQPKPQNKETRANKSATVSKKQSSSIMQKESSAKKVCDVYSTLKYNCMLYSIKYFVSKIYVNKWEL